MTMDDESKRLAHMFARTKKQLFVAFYSHSMRKQICSVLLSAHIRFCLLTGIDASLLHSLHNNGNCTIIDLKDDVSRIKPYILPHAESMLDKSDAAPSVDNDDAVIWYRVHNCDPYIGMYDLFYLDAVLLHKLILSDFILNDKYIIPIFSARPTYRLSNSSVFQNRAAMIILGDGIGDFFILLPLLRRLIRRLEQNGRQIFLLLAENCLVKSIINCFFPSIRYVYVPDWHHLSLYHRWCLLSGLFADVFNLQLNGTTSRHFANHMHAYEIFKKQTGIHEPIDFDEVASWFRHVITTSTQTSEKRRINSLMEGQEDFIALQVWTGPLDKDNPRAADPHMAYELCRLCQHAGYRLANTTPYPTGRYTLPGCIQTDGLSLMGALYLVSHARMFMGIDSCMGHAASLLGIGSVTLWSRYQSPLEIYAQKLIISFRPLRNNISIVPDPPDTPIDASLVFDVVNKMMHKKIPLCDSMTYEDSQKKQGVFYSVRVKQ